ncbi:MAG: hypothetical protein IPL27_26140 [Lewinellaceae bacterium]|nr:hypothetical protein [Lewinellaceae bacterium]
MFGSNHIANIPGWFNGAGGPCTRQIWGVAGGILESATDGGTNDGV